MIRTRLQLMTASRPRPALKACAPAAAVLGAVLTCLQGGARAADDPESYAVHGQFTFTEQQTSGFNAPYAGTNSLSPHANEETVDATLFLGRRLWSGSEIWIGPEIDQGFGLDDTEGVAGFPSGEAYKVGEYHPYVRWQRLFVRQTLNLDERRERLRLLARRAALVSPAARCAQQAQRLDEMEVRLSRAMNRRLAGHRERLGWLTGRAALLSPRALLVQRSMHLEELELRIYRALRHTLNEHRSALSDLERRLWRASPVLRVREAVARHSALLARLRTAGPDRVRRARARLLPLERTLNAVSPLATLERGYAIVSSEQGEILRDAANSAPGMIIEARLARGRIRAKVEKS